MVRVEQQLRLHPLPFAHLRLQRGRMPLRFGQHLSQVLPHLVQVLHVGGGAAPFRDVAVGVAHRQGTSPVP